MIRHDKSSRVALLGLALLLVASPLPLCLAAKVPARGAQAPATRGTTPAALSEDLSWGEVAIALRAEPPAVALERDLMVTLVVTTPASVKAELPDLRSRFSGFTLAEGYSDEATQLADGRRERRYHWRLTPAPGAATYRLAPFAVEVSDNSVAPPRRSSFATRPVLFPAAELGITASGPAEIALKPLWIAPTPRTIFGWVLGALALLAAIYGLLRLLLLLQHRSRLRRLSPRERAFAELEQLLRRRLIDKGLYKDFYIELTQVVRRYIERAHGISAPEQTTEEFLAAALKHPRFTPAILERLRQFLQSADLVKFAGQESNPQLASSAVETARDYVAEDAAQAASAVAEATAHAPREEVEA